MTKVNIQRINELLAKSKWDKPKGSLELNRLHSKDECFGFSRSIL